MRWGILIASVLVLGAPVPLTVAAEPQEREAYVERAEPICKLLIGFDYCRIEPSRFKG